MEVVPSHGNTDFWSLETWFKIVCWYTKLIYGGVLILYIYLQYFTEYFDCETSFVCDSYRELTNAFYQSVGLCLVGITYMLYIITSEKIHLFVKIYIYVRCLANLVCINNITYLVIFINHTELTYSIKNIIFPILIGFNVIDFCISIFFICTMWYYYMSARRNTSSPFT